MFLQFAAIPVIFSYPDALLKLRTVRSSDFNLSHSVN